MSESIFIQPHRPAWRTRGAGHPLLVGACLGAVVGVLGFAIVVSTVDVVRAALMSEGQTAEAGAPAFPTRELPREWRTWKTGVDVDHMYRRKPAQRLDWIREGGRG